MQSQDIEVLSALADWLDAGLTCHLCTIVETYGSSPRPAGSLLALNETGGLVGSLSGGCVEDDLVAALRAGELAHQTPMRMDYGVTAADTERLGLPCGGTLTVVAERILPDATNRSTHRKIATILGERKCVARTIALTRGARARAEEVSDFEPLALETSEDGVETLRQVYGPRRQLFLI
ncbi:MAG: XdhC family protein, partial [Pseudomonadales bacterium]|nr:XdhC family protein [Pseudomonadales bacterium]